MEFSETCALHIWIQITIRLSTFDRGLRNLWLVKVWPLWYLWFLFSVHLALVLPELTLFGVVPVIHTFLETLTSNPVILMGKSVQAAFQEILRDFCKFDFALSGTSDLVLLKFAVILMFCMLHFVFISISFLFND